MSDDSAIAALARAELGALTRYEIPHVAGIRAKLDANENPWPLPAEVAAALGQTLARVALHRYPDGGAAQLRGLLARRLGRSPDALVLGNGSDELIGLLVTAFARPRAGAARAGVAYPAPTFAVYRMAALASGCEPVEIPLQPDFTLDGDAVDRVLEARRPNLLFLALPNNPTGTLWPRDELVRILERRRDLIVVADEAYLDYSGAEHIDLLDAHANLVILRTLSKTGMAALRVGYLVAGPAIVRELEKVRPPYNVGALGQTAAAYLLEHHRALLDEQVTRVVAERDRLGRELARVPGLLVFPSRANFFLVRSEGATALWRRLAERGVLVRSFDRPGPLAGCLRITVGTPEENELLLAALLV